MTKIKFYAPVKEIAKLDNLIRKTYARNRKNNS